VPAFGAQASSTIYVDVNDPTPDDGGCGSPSNPCNTLQGGINVAGAGDTVRLFAGTYYERINVSKDLTIIGDNRATTRIDGQQQGRTFIVFDESTVSISNVTIQNGRSPDGGGLNSNFSTVRLTSVDVVSNTAVTGGAGVYCGYGSRMVISDTRIADNVVIGQLGSGGGLLVTADAHLELFDTTIEDNIAGQGGGALAAGTITVTDSSLIDNSARAAGGGLYCLGKCRLQRSRVAHNEITDEDGSGGGVFNGGTLRVIETVMADNAGGLYGGGLFLESGSADVIDSEFSSNSAELGGGAYVAPDTVMTVSGTTFSSNQAEVGGGLRNHGGALLTNVTFSANRALDNGGAVDNFIGTLTMLNVTITDNQADYDGDGTGDGGGAFRSDGTVSVKNSIIAGNSDASPTTKHPDCYGQFSSDGNNLVGDGSGCSGFSIDHEDLVGTSGAPIDPKLEPLADNGGSTRTHALESSSPAVDTGNNTGCPSTDQRGGQRPVDGDGDGTATCDIGSFELGPVVATLTPTPTASATLTPTPTITPTATLTPSTTPTASVTPPASSTPTATRLPTVGPSPTATFGPSPTPQQPTATRTATPLPPTPTATGTGAPPTATATTAPPTASHTNTPAPTTPPSATPTVPQPSPTPVPPSPTPVPPPSPLYVPFASR
jgi:hypothetical protein